MQAPHLTQPDKFSLFRGTGAIWADGRGLLLVGRLHGVLAHLPSAQIAPVAHARLDQSFPSAQAARDRQAISRRGQSAPAPARS